MASLTKRSVKFQDFTAHRANVNCLALGHKSGRVMVTGGDDKKVNLWAVGKTKCFMSLSGHITPVECVQFNQLEELVCAGSRAGALKVWDLEAAKLVRTLNGHKYAIKCIDFHPYGDFLVSGSADRSIKIWDTRKKGVIMTYNDHKGTVNSVKFSPDGQWIATGGEDSLIKIWDLRVGKVLKTFDDHVNQVTCVEFHPHEFLLATGSADRSVHFYDLENFQLVSESDVGAVRCLCFNPDGDCLFSGTRDYLKIIGWEPSRLYDTVPVYWEKIGDISVASDHLIGASFDLTNVQVYVVDLKECKPFSSNSNSPLKSAFSTSSPLNANTSLRKSFSKADRPPSLKTKSLDVKTIEESTSGTDPEEESMADITNLKDYNEIFRGRALQRTPPPILESFQEPERDHPDPCEPQIIADVFKTNACEDNFGALSLDSDLNNYQNAFTIQKSNTDLNRSKSNLDQVYHSKLTKQQNNRENIVPNNKVAKAVGNGSNSTTASATKFALQRQSSCKDVPERGSKGVQTHSNNIKHSVSEVNINKGSMSSRTTNSRKNSFSQPIRNSTNSTSVPNVSKIPSVTVTKTSERNLVRTSFMGTSDIYVNTRISPERETPHRDDDTYIPVLLDRPVGLDFNEFLPKNHNALGYEQQMPDMSEAEVMGIIIRGHEPTMSIVNVRQRSLALVMAQYRSKDMKTAMETALSMDDTAILVDLLGVIQHNYSIWNLDLCVSVLPKMMELLQSKYETYVTAGCNTMKLILKHFGPTIRTNVNSPVGSFGIDISREERYQKSVICNEYLMEIRTFVAKKQSSSATKNVFREIYSLFETYLD